jgi:lysozyme
MIKGLDVSQIQGVIDFAAVAATGVQFVMCRCGVGNNGSDSMYAQNIANAQAAGLKVGAYHFVFPLPTTAANPSRAPAAQAAAHFAAAGNVPVVACDLEWPVSTDWAKWGCSATQIVQWVTEYLQAYENLSGVRPIVYTYPYFAQSINLPASFAQAYQLWIASYEVTPAIPAPWTNWILWQNSGGTGAGAAHLPNGAPVDTDYAQDLSLWDSPVAAAPSPPDPPPVIPVPVPAPIPDSDPIPAPTNSSPSTVSTISSIWEVISKLFK